MVVFRPDELIPEGQVGENLLEGLASDVANSVCGLYQSYPRSFGISNPVGDAVSEFNSGFWDDFCGRLPNPKIPSPPTSPFQGGQCSCVDYRVSFTVDIRRRSDDSLVDVRSGELQVWGPVTGIAIEDPGPSGADSVAVVARGSGPACQPGYSANSSAARELFYMTNLRGVSVRRGDNLTDNCGDIPPSYPNVIAPPSNPGTYTYPGNDGVSRDINFSVDFDPEIDGPLVRLPDIPNVCVGFGFSGIEIDLCTNKPGSGSGGDISGILDKLDQIEDDLDAIRDNTDESLDKDPQEELPPEPTNPPEQPIDGFYQRCVPGLRFVKVSLTNIPSNANLEKGSGGFDRIDDAGWISFVRDGYFFPPQRVEYGGAIFEAPSGVECFVLQLRFGFTASVAVVVKEE